MNVAVNGKYCERESHHVSDHWAQVCADHEEEFPLFYKCEPGTFNVLVTDQKPYVPPGEEKYRAMARERGRAPHWYGDGNHISPCAKVVEINGTPVEVWIYRGGHTDRPLLELLSRVNLSRELALHDGDAVTMLITEVAEGSSGMPGPPPSRPGKIVKGS